MGPTADNSYPFHLICQSEPCALWIFDQAGVISPTGTEPPPLFLFGSLFSTCVCVDFWSVIRFLLEAGWVSASVAFILSVSKKSPASNAGFNLHRAIAMSPRAAPQLPIPKITESHYLWSLALSSSTSSPSSPSSCKTRLCNARSLDVKNTNLPPSGYIILT